MVQEWLASRSNERFRVYRGARLAHEAYLSRMSRGYARLTAQDHAAARADAALAEAERQYAEALRLTREEGRWRDIATACYQTGILNMLFGEWDKAERFLRDAWGIVSSLPQISRGEQQALILTRCMLGVVAFHRGDVGRARENLDAARAGAHAIVDLELLAQCERALEELDR